MNNTKSLSLFRLLPVLLLMGAGLFPLATAQEEPPLQPPTGITKKAIIVGQTQEGDGPRAIQIQAVEFSGDGEKSFGGPGIFSFSTRVGDGPNAFSMSANSDLMNLLQNESIRSEIELVDDQYKKMQDFYKQRQSEIMKEVKSLVNPVLSGDEKKLNKSVQLSGKKLKEMIDKQRKEAEDKLKELLLPHQLKRLEQVSHQVKMKNSGTLNSLVRGSLKDELELSKDDIENLKTKWKSIDEKLEQEIAKLRAKAKKELLGELSSKQRRKLEELLGDEFDYQPTDWRSRMKNRTPSVQLGNPKK